MARNAEVSLTPSSWTELTAGDVTTVTIQNLSRTYPVHIMATTGSAPTGGAAGFEVQPMEAWEYIALATLFPGVAGADRLFAYTAAAGQRVFVSHA